MTENAFAGLKSYSTVTFQLVVGVITDHLIHSLRFLKWVKIQQSLNSFSWCLADDSNGLLDFGINHDESWVVGDNTDHKQNWAQFQ